MTAASNDPNRSNAATKGNVRGILKNAFKPKKGKARGLIQETGTAPNKFRKGKVN